jgi:deoxyadenosine/deoxycytidine kinase
LTGSGPLVGIVGPCGAGKSTLKAALLERGIRAREVAQEHSYVPTMWRRITNPDWLIYLDVSLETARQRGRQLSDREWNDLQGRLAHARAHADLVVDTNALDPSAVLERVMGFLKRET